ncbi:GTPase ObgE [Candidatus Microgenomates bacterium]|nr:GTPase ObgE [Candidatus Microgenomates bacterium]
MFYDRATINVKAGDGGNGAVLFRHSKEAAKGGPDGGDGGRGGNIVLSATTRENTLFDFVRQKEYEAENGAGGGHQRAHGKSGEDLILKVPVGTLVYKILPENGRQSLGDLKKDTDQIVVARGGRGGFGNAHFTSSTRQTPKFAEFGSPGEDFSLELELKLVADVAIIGFPSAGKSSLISKITAARPKIADYPFTTLVPHLGIAKRGKDTLVVADVPGLIEGASEGKGLGHEFLRHIQRSKMVIHLIDGTREDWVADYKMIRSELLKFDKKLAEKKELVAINKIDLIDAGRYALASSHLRKTIKAKKIYGISALTGKNIDDLFDEVFRLCQKITEPEVIEDSKRIFTFADANPNLFEIKKVKTGFRIYCKKMEDLSLRLDLNNWQARQRFFDVAKKLGIVKELKKQGLMEEQILWIGEKVVEWEEG